jgi:hypothetical protein
MYRQKEDASTDQKFVEVTHKTYCLLLVVLLTESKELFQTIEPSGSRLFDFKKCR